MIIIIGFGSMMIKEFGKTGGSRWALLSTYRSRRRGKKTSEALERGWLGNIEVGTGALEETKEKSGPHPTITASKCSTPRCNLTGLPKGLRQI